MIQAISKGATVSWTEAMEKLTGSSKCRIYTITKKL